MKKKARKLLLSKETIVDLSNQDMKVVKGGLTWTDPRVCTANTRANNSCKGTICA